MNLNEMKNDTARKNAIRSTLAEVIVKAMGAEFGEDNVVFIPYAIEPNGGSKINGGSVAVRVGSVVDKNGFEVDAVAIVAVTVKGWNDVTTKSGRNTLAVNFDDILEAVNAEISARTSKTKKGD